MNTYIVVAEAEIPQDSIDRLEPGIAEGTYRLADNVVLIRTYIDQAKVLSRVLEMSSEGKRRGVVFEYDGSHAGYHESGFWDWLRAGDKPSF